MSELLDKQMWQPNTKLNKARINLKCVMIIKKNTKQPPLKKIFNDRKDFVRVLNINDEDDQDRTKDRDSRKLSIQFKDMHDVLVR